MKGRAIQRLRLTGSVYRDLKPDNVFFITKRRLGFCRIKQLMNRLSHERGGIDTFISGRTNCSAAAALLIACSFRFPQDQHRPVRLASPFSLAIYGVCCFRLRWRSTPRRMRNCAE